MKYIRILSIILTIFLVGSCGEDFLDVTNVNNLSANNFYQTEEDFESLLITTYMPMAYSNMYGVNMHVLMYALDDRVIHEQFATQIPFDCEHINLLSKQSAKSEPRLFTTGALGSYREFMMFSAAAMSATTASNSIIPRLLPLAEDSRWIRAR